MIWLHLCKFVDFGPITPEFKRDKDVHPLIDQQFGYVRFVAPLLGLVGISIEFCFNYSLGASLLCRAGYTLGSAAHF